MRIMTLLIAIFGLWIMGISGAYAYNLTGFGSGGSGSSGSSGGYLRSNGGGTSYGRLNFGGRGSTAISTTGGKETPHRAAHVAYLAKKKRAALSRKNAPAPCGNYGRLPTYCKRGL